MALMLYSFYLMRRQSWLAMATIGAIGIIHPPTFFVLGLVIIIYLIIGPNKKYVFLTGVGALIISLTFNWQQFINGLNYFNADHNFGQIKNYSPEKSTFLLGQFVNFNLYLHLSLLYIPFAVISTIKLITDKKNSYPLLLFIASILILAFNIIYKNRFIITLDLAAIILAGPALAIFIKNLWQSAVGKIATGLLLTIGLIIIIYQSWFFEPFFTSYKEIEEIKKISLTEKSAKIITNGSLYYPFLEKYSQRTIVYSNEENRIINSQNISETLKQLKKIKSPVYIYVGEKDFDKIDLRYHSNFQFISPRLWKYQP